MRSSARYAVPTLLILLCFAAPALAQSTTKPTVKTPRGSISGRVTIKDRGAPGVAVGVRRNDAFTAYEPFIKTTTDQDGVYRLTNLAPGSYEVVPSAPAYVSSGANFGRGKTVVVGEDETVEDINFSLVRGGVITGKVTDADGRPVILQLVTVFRAEVPGQSAQQQQQQHLAMIASASTDDRGIYRLFGISAGSYKVAAGKGDDGFSGFSSSSVSYKQVFHPDVTDKAKATVIELNEGSEATNVDITLGRTVSTFSVSGRIVEGESGLPAHNLRIGLRRVVGQRSEFVNSFATSDERGYFMAEGLIPGKYAVFLFPGGNAELRAESITFDIIDQDITGLTIKLTKAASIAGVVMLDSEDKAARAAFSQLQLRAFVMPADGGSAAFSQSAMSPISPDGSFRLAGLPTGVASISLSSTASPMMSPKGFTIGRIERDGIVTPRLDVKDGEQITGVRLIVSYGAATLRGVVKVENGTLRDDWRIIVRLTKPNETLNTLRPATVDARGHFLMEGIPGGLYELQAYIVGGNQAPTRPVKQDIGLQDGVVTDVIITIDLANR